MLKETRGFYLEYLYKCAYLPQNRTPVFCSAPGVKQPAVLCRRTSKWRLPQLLEESGNLSHITVQEKRHVLLLPGKDLNPAPIDLSFKNANGNI